MSKKFVVVLLSLCYETNGSYKVLNKEKNVTKNNIVA